MKLPLGIDVSHETLDTHFINEQQVVSIKRIENTCVNIEGFLQHHDPNKVFIVAEPTGTYSDKLFELAHKNGFELRLVDPHKSSQYTRLMGHLNKTDELAAELLTQMGSTLELPLYTPPSQVMKERKQIVMILNALSKQSRMLSNQIHALEQRLSPSSSALGTLKASLLVIEEQKVKLEKELQALTDEDAEEFAKYARSVVGIRPKSVDLLLIYTNGLNCFDNKDQVPKFIGTVPSTHQSGTSINRRGKITKRGPSLLRACLYNAAKSAIRFNHAYKALYQRLRANGKCHKLAMVAIINKLLHQVFAVVKSKNLFDNELYINQNKIC